MGQSISVLESDGVTRTVHPMDNKENQKRTQNRFREEDIKNLQRQIDAIKNSPVFKTSPSLQNIVAMKERVLASLTTGKSS